jgi:hypothetical protein
VNPREALWFSIGAAFGAAVVLSALIIAGVR